MGLTGAAGHGATRHAAVVRQERDVGRGARVAVRVARRRRAAPLDRRDVGLVQRHRGQGAGFTFRAVSGGGGRRSGFACRFARRFARFGRFAGVEGGAVGAPFEEFGVVVDVVGGSRSSRGCSGRFQRRRFGRLARPIEFFFLYRAGSGLRRSLAVSPVNKASRQAVSIVPSISVFQSLSMQ